jgi:ribosomal protein S27AE
MVKKKKCPDCGKSYSGSKCSCGYTEKKKAGGGKPFGGKKGY